MRDSEVVAAMVADDPRGLEQAYTRHADRLHDYCTGMLGDPHAAADVVHDTFLVARERIGQLRDAEALRPWLYAIARSGCLRILRSRRRLRPLAAVGDDDGSSHDFPDDDVDMDTGLRRDELRTLVRAALGGLNPREREVVELTLRHDLSVAELAAALHVPSKHAHALVSTARAQLERCLAVLLVGRTGRDACAELSAMLSGWDGTLTPLLRKRVHRHLEQCATCAAERHRRVRPEALLGLLPLVAAPAWLYGQVRTDAFDPDLVAHRTHLAKQLGPNGSGGFPGRHRRRSAGPRVAAVAAAVALLAAGGLSAPVLMDTFDRADGPGAAVARAPVGPTSPAEPVPSSGPTAAAPSSSGSAPGAANPSAASPSSDRPAAPAPPPASDEDNPRSDDSGSTALGPPVPEDPPGGAVTGVDAGATDLSEPCDRVWQARVTATVSGGPAETVTVSWTDGARSGELSMDGGPTWSVDVGDLRAGAFRYRVTAVGAVGEPVTSEWGGLVHQGCARQR